MNSNMIFKEAPIEDIPVIAYLADKIWKKHYVSVISPDQISYMLNKFYSSSALEEQIANHQKFFLAYQDNEITGYLSITEQSPGNLFLNKFYIDDSFRRKGAGTQFFRFILEEFKPETIQLTVNRKNYTAINFYFKLGFIIDRAEDFDIGEGYRMEDFVMKWMKTAGC